MRSVLTLLVGVCMPLAAMAQTEEASPLLTATKSMQDEEMLIENIKKNPLPAQFGLYYSQSISQSSLRNAYDSLLAPSVGYGFSLQAAYNLDPIPLAFGADITLHFWGEKERVFGPYAGDPFRNRVELTGQNFSLPILTFARFQPNIGTWVFPYLEAVGGTMLYSSTFSAKRYQADSVIASNTENEGSFNFTYGVGAGFAVKFADVITLPNTLQRFLLDVRFRYLWGTSVEIPTFTPTEDQRYEVSRISVAAPQQIFFQVGIMVQM